MRPSGYTVNSKVMRATLGVAQRAGLSPESLAAEVGVDVSGLEDIDTRVPYEAWLAAWDIIASKSGDRLIALHAVQNLPKGHFDVVDYVFASSETLGIALERYCRYFAILSTAVEHRFEGNVVRRVYAPGADTRSPFPAEFGFGALIYRTRTWTEQPWHPLRVDFPHPPPKDVDEARRILGCHVRYDAEEGALHFDEATLALRMRSPEPELVKILEAHAKAALDRLPRETDLVETVRGVLAKQLRGGDPSLAECAKRVGLGARSLHRRLAEAGTSHTKLLDDVRHELALRYLDDRTLSIAEVGFLLGFADVSAFYRAFRRWTGRTPAQLRATG